MITKVFNFFFHPHNMPEPPILLRFSAFLLRFYTILDSLILVGRGFAIQDIL